MGFFWRLCRRRKRIQSSVTNSDTEALVEKAQSGTCESQARVVEDARYDIAKMPQRSSELFFDEIFIEQTEAHRGVHLAGNISLGVAINSPETKMEAVTSAPRPLQRVPGTALSLPRFQEQIYNILRDELTPFEDKNGPLAHGHWESTINGTHLPTKIVIQPRYDPCDIVHRASVAGSAVPSLICSEVSSGRLSSTQTSLTSSSSLASHHSSSSLSSFLSARRMKHQRESKKVFPSMLLRARQIKTKSETSYLYNYASSPPVSSQTVLPYVRNANTYAGSRSMSGPYPCITSRRQVPLKSTNTTTSFQTTDYYP